MTQYSVSPSIEAFSDGTRTRTLSIMTLLIVLRGLCMSSSLFEQVQAWISIYQHVLRRHTGTYKKKDRTRNFISALNHAFWLMHGQSCQAYADIYPLRGDTHNDPSRISNGCCVPQSRSITQSIATPAVELPNHVSRRSLLHHGTRP